MQVKLYTSNGTPIVSQSNLFVYVNAYAYQTDKFDDDLNELLELLEWFEKFGNDNENNNLPKTSCKCECGAESVGSDNHSAYCPKK